jgi:hypothetical protein
MSRGDLPRLDRGAGSRMILMEHVIQADTMILTMTIEPTSDI